MNCLSEETAMLYAESELAPVEARLVEAHLPECAPCRELIAMLREENVALVSVLRETIPNRRLRTLAHLAGSIAASVAVGVPMQWAAALASHVGMLWNYAAGLPFEIAFRALRTLTGVALLLVLTQAVSPAMTVRDSKGSLVIPSGETIADSVMATGETVLVEGRIEGNLIMFGRSVEIRGEVIGDVVAGAQEVRITGHVTGNVMAGAQSITVSGHVGGNLYAAGQNVHVEKSGRVDLEVLCGAATADVEGSVGRGLTVGSGTVSISGEVERGVTFSGDRVLVRQGGKVGGDLKAEVADKSGVQVDPGASVAGKVNVTVRIEEAKPWAQAGTYVWEAAVLGGALLVAWLLMTLFPGFFAGTVQQVRNLGSLGFGFIGLVVTPVAAVLLCITVVGIPMAVGSVFLYVAGLYLAKIFVGAYLGRELIGTKSGSGLPTVLGLLAGLAILQAVFLVPYAGGVFKFAVICLGMGAVTVQVWRQVRAIA